MSDSPSQVRHIALLRGINVGGRNKVPMADLRECFEALGFSAVSTYIQSGNVLFSTTEQGDAELVQRCERAIEKRFGFPVTVAVISADEYADALAHTPSWWGDDPGVKHNAIFVIAPTTAAEVMVEVGAAKPEYERVAARGPVIFWSAPLATFNRTRYAKIVGGPAYRRVTIRNANTTRKLLALLQA